MKAIYFDMDQTIADLAGVPNWLEKLHAEDVSPYVEAAPMYDMAQLDQLMREFINLGFVIGVISWSAMGGSKEYNKETRAAKKMWIEQNLPCVSEFHVVAYGTPKHQVRNIKNSILVDDNEKVRNAWHGMTVDANKNILVELKNLLDLIGK